MAQEDKSPKPTGPMTLPVLPLRDVVVFPHMVIPLFVGRKKSIRALERAMESGKQIMLVAQKSASDDDPGIEQIHTIGTVASILQLLKLPDGTVKVLVEGEQRAEVQHYTETDDSFTALVDMVESVQAESRESEALMRSVLAEFDQYVKLNMKIPPEILTSLAGIEEPGRLADAIAAHLSLKIEDK
jgi:ATP-dependent Lon protease